MEKNAVGNSVKGCTQIKKDEDGDESRVSCKKEVISDFQQSTSSAVGRSKTGLKRFIETVEQEVSMKLRSNQFFEDFRNKRKV